MKKNLFIVFEGIDGTGKSTQIKLLEERMKLVGRSVYSTFEPTNNLFGKIIRDIFSHKIDADQRTIASLFVTDRLHHLLNNEDGILLKLSEGFDVISDRYYFSSFAYHSVHTDMNWVVQSNAQSIDLLKADITFFIDIAPIESMKRINATRANIEMYENLENLELVRSKYLTAFELYNQQENIVFIDGNRSIEEVSAQIWQRVLNHL